MKKMVILGLLVITTSSFANNQQQHKFSSMSFKEQQTKMIKMINVTEKFLLKNKECVLNASDKQDLKKCRKIARKKREAIKKKYKKHHKKQKRDL